MSRACSRKVAGFTLVEMLVAMAIFSTLIAVLMMGYRQGLLLWEKGQQQSREWLDYEVRYRLLDSMFSQALIADNEYKKGMFAPFLKGTETSVRFISAAPIMDMPGRVRPVEVNASKEEDGSWSLRYREGARYSDPARGLKWESEWVNLLDGLQSVSFSFEAPAFPLPDELSLNDLSEQERLRYRDAPEWLDQFDSYVIWHYPSQVLVRFTDEAGRDHTWLFAPPRWPDAWTMEAYSDV